MQPEITQAVSNITISKTYIDHETRIAVLSLLLKITFCHQFEIVQRRSMPTCALNSFQERQFGFHVRPLVDKNRPGLCKVYVRKRDLVEN